MTLQDIQDAYEEFRLQAPIGKFLMFSHMPGVTGWYNLPYEGMILAANKSNPNAIIALKTPEEVFELLEKLK